MDKSKGSMIALIKKLSELPSPQELVVTQSEYNLMVRELWEMDEFLHNKYLVPESVPHIYSLYGVKLIVGTP